MAVCCKLNNIIMVLFVVLAPIGAVLRQFRCDVVPLRRSDDRVGWVRVVQASHSCQRQEAGQMVRSNGGQTNSSFFLDGVVWCMQHSVCDWTHPCVVQVVRQEVHAPQHRGALWVRLPVGPRPRSWDLRRGGVHQDCKEARAGDFAAGPGHRQGGQELWYQCQKERHWDTHVSTYILYYGPLIHLYNIFYRVLIWFEKWVSPSLSSHSSLFGLINITLFTTSLVLMLWGIESFH